MRLGLFKRQTVWAPTLRGWLVLGVALLALLGVGVSQVEPFLSPTERLPAEVLVVEGWMPDYALAKAAAEFRAGHYRYIITDGGPLREGWYQSTDKTYAELAAHALCQLGLKPEQVIPAPYAWAQRERTLTAAEAVERWLATNDPGVRAINVFTLGAHARRSRLVFQRVMGRRVRVGVIALPDRDYDPARWWAFSEGIREVLSEGIGYLHAWLAPGRAR